MNRKIKLRLFRGSIDTELEVTYVYFYRDGNDPNVQYPTLKKAQNGTIIVDHSYGLSISKGFDGAPLFIGAKTWNQFVTLFDKSVSLISENLLEIFPDVNLEEFEIDQRALQRFQSEKACTTAGISMTPTVWVNASQQCFPAIEIKTLKAECVIPLEDAIPLRRLLNTIDPIVYASNTLQMIATIVR